MTGFVLEEEEHEYMLAGPPLPHDGVEIPLCGNCDTSKKEKTPTCCWGDCPRKPKIICTCGQHFCETDFNKHMQGFEDGECPCSAGKAGKTCPTHGQIPFTGARCPEPGCAQKLVPTIDISSKSDDDDMIFMHSEQSLEEAPTRRWNRKKQEPPKPANSKPMPAAVSARLRRRQVSEPRLSHETLEAEYSVA